MLGGQPVEQDTVRNFTRETAHLRAQRGDDDARPQLLLERGDAVAHALQRVGIGAADAQQQSIERQLVGLDALDDALGAARVQRNHADAEIEAARLSGCEREGGQSVRLAGVVHPERGVAERLGLSRTRADDLGSGGREQCESISHRASS